MFQPILLGSSSRMFGIFYLYLVLTFICFASPWLILHCANVHDIWSRTSKEQEAGKPTSWRTIKRSCPPPKEIRPVSKKSTTITLPETSISHQTEKGKSSTQKRPIGRWYVIVPWRVFLKIGFIRSRLPGHSPSTGWSVSWQLHFERAEATGGIRRFHPLDFNDLGCPPSQ